MTNLCRYCQRHLINPSWKTCDDIECRRTRWRNKERRRVERIKVGLSSGQIGALGIQSNHEKVIITSEVISISESVHTGALPEGRSENEEKVPRGSEVSEVRGEAQE